MREDDIPVEKRSPPRSSCGVTAREYVWEYVSMQLPDKKIKNGRSKSSSLYALFATPCVPICPSLPISASVPVSVYVCLWCVFVAGNFEISSAGNFEISKYLVCVCCLGVSKFLKTSPPRGHIYFAVPPNLADLDRGEGFSKGPSTGFDSRRSPAATE